MSVITGVVAAMTLAACGGDDDPSADPTEQAADESEDASNQDQEESGDGGGAPSGTLAVNWGGFPDSWTPGAEGEAGYTRVPYENLTQVIDGEISPMLATEWEQTDEALTLTLREDVTFHDGTPFDAEAVKVNLETVRDHPGPFAGPLQVIDSIDVVDDLTVQLNLSEPTPSMLTTLSTRATPIASPQAIEDGSIAQEPVGTGPWAYDPDASTPGTRMTFNFVEDYWGGPESVGFETIELYAIPDDNAAVGALQTGEIHLTDTEPPQVEGLEGAGMSTLMYPAIRNNPIFFDRGPGGVFEDPDVRRAACYALNTEEYTQVEPDMAVRTQHFTEGEIGYNPDIAGYPHDLEMAQDLYEQAGNPTVDVEVLAAPFTQTQNEVYAAQLAEIDMQVSVQVAPPPQWASTWNDGTYPMGLGANDELTAYDWYQSWFAADAPGNPSGVESDELAAAADAAIAAGTSPEAADLWAEVTRIISDEALTCGHIVGQETLAWNPEFVQGVAAPPQAFEPNLVNLRDLRPVESE